MQPQVAAPLSPADGGCDDDTAWDFPTRVMVSATDAPAPHVCGPISVFGMADAVAAALVLRKMGRFGAASGFTPATVTREDGVVRVCGAQYPSGRWDEDRHEQERQRRARQKPPRPSRKARTRGKKVREWDGEGCE